MKRGTLLIALVVLCVMGIAACGSSHHHVTPIATNNFVFYAAGEDATPSFYSIAGVVTITADGNNTITGGVQDFNDGDGTTSPQPGGDTINPTGSSLTFNPDGSGNAILTLATSNAALGVGGVETFALSFSNANHAIISQFDGTATSSGSYDLQTLPTAPLASSSFSFTSTGANSDGFAVAEGGVFTLDGSGDVTGSVDINNAGTVTLNNSPSEGTVIPASDTFGRGTVTGSLDGTTAVVNFYIVNSEVIRIIDVDATDTAVGSAYGQGTAAGNFAPSSIGQSAFYISGVDDFYNGAGQFFTFVEDAGAKPRANKRPARPEGGAVCSGSECLFDGTADVNESVDGGAIATDAAFDGTYVLASNGYGSFSFVDPPLDTDLVTFGLYAVDPTLNILDPNNSASGLTGGVLIAEMDENLVGTGALIPQVVDPVVTDIAADVIFNAQGNADEGDGVAEFDLLGASSVDAGAFAGEGFIDDPAGILNDGTAILDQNSTFSATFADDGDGIGRYLSGDGGFVASSPVADTSIDFTVTAYDANGDQLFWVETDEDSTWGGSIQASTFEVPDAKKAQAKPKTKKQ
ncbi:MAG: hypothetical protein ABSF68_15000 [Candidatus Acidiferrales bacterium]